MLDGKRYYAASPDENPKKPSLRALLHALESLEAQFCKHFKFAFVNQNQDNLNRPRRAER
jgi:hypothetical protein